LNPRDAAAARAWRDASYAVACDVDERWEHGRILRASRYPTYYDLNCLLVEDAAPLEGETIRAVADLALQGLAHRLVVFDHLENAEPLRAEFEAAGWKVMRLLWLRHVGGAVAMPTGAEIAEVGLDDVRVLRFAWNHEEEDVGGDDAAFGAFLDGAREVAALRGARVFAALEGGEPIGFVQLERIGTAGEIAQAYVRGDRRGGGRGGALVSAAIAAADGVEDLYICADDEDRAKHLYERLGFRAVWRTMEFLLPPRG
jgi:ribosomal protein S18 acetylase RimI-like enzyme